MIRATSFLAALILSATAFAAETLQIDPAHSSVEFKVRHMLISNVPGRLSGISGSINYDANDLAKSSIDVTVDTTTISTENESRDKHLRSADFFETEKYPQARFISKKIEKRGEQWYAIGDLTIKDVTKQVEMPFELTAGNTSFGPAVGITATTKIIRKDFHINYGRVMDNGGAVVGDEVKLEINLEARPPKKEDPNKAAEKKEAPKK
jgi:polyisoprenoid-binding protein YceI